MKLDELNNDLINLKEKLDDLGSHLDLTSKEAKIRELEAIISKPNFWDNQEEATAVTDELSFVSKPVKKFGELKSAISTCEEIIGLLKIEEDDSLLKELEDNIQWIKSDINEFEISVLLDGEYDGLNCYLEIHPGAGGTESCDWASMLLRMYQRFAGSNDFKVEILDEQKGEDAGIKSALMKISGPYAYGYLKGEQGVHRLVRISPFDSNARRHTSFASVSVIPEFNNIKEVDIKETDLKIDVYHSSGAGGQSVNTTDSAVRMTHLPTGIVVTCQNERSQLKNKEKALSILKSKLYQLEVIKQEEEINNLKGNASINFGSQIRNYTLEPYTLVKDNRTGYESTNASKVLDGDIKGFIESYLRME